MRVLLFSINYAPELTGIGKYTGEMAEWLVTQGARVTVVTAPPYYPAWRVARPYRAYRYRHERLRGVDVIRCPLFVPKRVTAFKRLLHLASFAVSSLPVILWLAIRQRPDVIVVIEPPLFAAPAAWLAARLAGADAWLHVQDFEVDAAFGLGLLRPGRVRLLVDRCERWLMRRFDRVTTISARMVDRLLAKRVSRTRASLFPNWVDLEDIRPLAAKRERAGSDETVVLYSGNMGVKQGLETLIRAAELLRDAGESRLKFVLCGDGVARLALERAASGLPNVAFRPLVPTERLNELLNEADIHVLPQRADAEDLVFPSKLTNMLASGRPVVATANPGTQIATLLEGCGVTVPPQDPAALAAALRSLADDPDRRGALGAEARRTAERLWDKHAVLSAAFAHYRPAAIHDAGTAVPVPDQAQPDVAGALLRARQ